MPPNDDAASPLKKFGYCVGYIQLVVYFIVIIYCIKILVTRDNDNLENTTDQEEIPTLTIFGQDLDVTTIDPELLKSEDSIWVPMVFLLLAFVCLITAICLLYGLKSNSPEFLLPWMMLNAIAIIVVFSVGIAKALSDGAFTEVRVVIYLFFAGFHGFVVYLIYGLYKEMDERR